MTWIILIIQISFKKNHVGVLSLNGYDLREWTENLLNSSVTQEKDDNLSESKIIKAENKDKSDEEINMRGVEHGNKTMNISKNRMGEKTVLIDIYADGPNYRMMEVSI